MPLFDGEREQRRDRAELVVLGLPGEGFALLLVLGLAEPVPEGPAMVGGVLADLKITALLPELLQRPAVVRRSRLHIEVLPGDLGVQRGLSGSGSDRYG